MILRYLVMDVTTVHLWHFLVMNVQDGCIVVIVGLVVDAQIVGLALELFHAGPAKQLCISHKNIFQIAYIMY